MSVRAILAKASARGVEIAALEGQLSVRGAREAVVEMLPEIKAHKTEILMLLAANDPALPPELDRLIGLVSAHHGFTPEETREAREIAAGDVQNALVCFRELAREARLLADRRDDDRVTCATCSNLVHGKCRAAAQGLVEGAWRDYSPVPDLPRRCEHFRAKEG